MGGSSSSAKKCVIEAPIYKSHLEKLITLASAIEKLAQGIAKDNLSGKTVLDKLPKEFEVDPISYLLPTDSAADNAATRYNGFVGFFAQLDKDKRISSAQDRLSELVKLREIVTTQVANMCV